MLFLAIPLGCGLGLHVSLASEQRVIRSLPTNAERKKVKSGKVERHPGRLGRGARSGEAAGTLAPPAASITAAAAALHISPASDGGEDITQMLRRRDHSAHVGAIGLVHIKQRRVCSPGSF